jgi:hypothetical protein
VALLPLGPWAPRTRLEWTLDLITGTVAVAGLVIALTGSPLWWLIAGLAVFRLVTRFRARLQGRRPGQWRPPPR